MKGKGSVMNMRRNLKITGTAVSLAVLGFLSGCAAPKSDDAILALAAGEYETAANFSVAALRDNPEDPYALMVAGLAFEGLGFPNKSRRFYEDLIELNVNEVSMFGTFRPVAPESMMETAKKRLTFMEHKKRPFAAVRPDTGIAEFTEVAFQPAENGVKTGKAEKTEKTVLAGGLDMLSDGDRNVVQRFLTLMQLTDEQLVTRQEFEMRRAANLGGLLPYTLSPAGLGMDLPAPSAKTLSERLNALKTALELRSITPREHAVERDIILEALLPSVPQRRMIPVAPPKDVLEGATALRRIEMLKDLGLITPLEAKNEQEAVEKLVYMKLGMRDANKGINAQAASACIKKCLSTPQVVCPAAAPAKKKTPAKKKPAPAKKKTVQPSCVCPAQ